MATAWPNRQRCSPRGFSFQRESNPGMAGSTWVKAPSCCISRTRMATAGPINGGWSFPGLALKIPTTFFIPCVGAMMVSFT